MHGREGRRRTTRKNLGSAARRKRQQLKLDWIKSIPLAKAGLNIGYSWPTRVNTV
jgi:hypothetical protein